MTKENTVHLGKPKPSKSLKKGKKPVKKVSSKRSRKLVAHALLRDIVILRDKSCVCPPPAKGHSAVLQAGHLIPGTKGGTYFSLFNVFLQCQSCNQRHVHFPHYYTNWFIGEFGRIEYDKLCSESENMGLKSYEMEEMIVQLQAIKEKQLLAIELEKYFKPYFTQREILTGAWRSLEYGFSLKIGEE